MLVELVANTRVNQQVSIHPTTDAIAIRNEREREELYNDSKSDPLACYNNPISLIASRRAMSEDGLEFLTMKLGRDAQDLAMKNKHPRDVPLSQSGAE